MANKVLLISEDEIKNNSIMEQNTDSKVLGKIISNVQMIQLNPILGDTLYNQIMDEVYTAATGGTALSDSTKTLLDSYIIPFLTYAVQVDFIVLNNYKISNKGTIKLNDVSGSNIQSSEIEYVKNYYDNYKGIYKKKLIDFLAEGKLTTETDTDKNVEAESIGWYLKTDNCL
jgi:hypothetical protein